MPLCKRGLLDLKILDNFCPIFNLPFLGRVVKRVVSIQLQRALDEADYPDPFQFGFRSGYSTETLITLVNDLWRAQDGW